ncbi:MAG: hypothetical protein ACREA4_10395 [Nitrososphaera sp.]
MELKRALRTAQKWVAMPGSTMNIARIIILRLFGGFCLISVFLTVISFVINWYEGGGAVGSVEMLILSGPLVFCTGLGIGALKWADKWERPPLRDVPRPPHPYNGN